MDTGPRLAGVLVAALAACSHEQPPAIPADRPVLLWYGSAAQDQNRRNLPPGFGGPDEHACAADTTRIYLGELFLQGNVQVKWHWSPVVRGPDADKPTLDQPEFSLAGTLVDASDSSDDVLADHPFGFDVVADVTPDAPFAFLPFNGPVFTQGALLAAVQNPSIQRLTTHALMTANRFDALDWAVCAPLPRPARATLDASWRFTARTGVTITAAPLEADGCVRILATMTSAYTPMPLAHADADWPWADLSTSASNQLGQTIDVRQALIDTLQQSGFPNASQAPALQPDHPPLVDTYAPLLARAGADADSPTALAAGADDQPFPFYGRVRVGWK